MDFPNKIPIIPLFRKSTALDITPVLSFLTASNKHFSTLLGLGYTCFGSILTKMETHGIWLQLEASYGA
jgi:hypothetical protein